ncbi:MAG: hypothetical protein COX57_12595 [Alphaproteobacteria bacterium CG_4_10_14_0_2_um_filter_63_37]|nr:MAG: hypothetical protein AUJ55_11755 [Proteobacteria bacterium CG1_02_64_396]PJA23649.1 MAG: hypothetical protein COX57_12595 [Alphaproteobacteria bacterium CG_4_10_14_0_2_um_filter_63_37]
MRPIRPFALLALLLFPLLSHADPINEPLAQEAVQKVQDLLRAKTNTATYAMEVVRLEWRRTMRFDSWDDNVQDRFFIRVLAPAKDKDTTFLKVGTNLWTYLPKLERDIRIPPSMMLSSWMGSDFTNDDLVKASSVVLDYTHRVIERHKRGDLEILTIESRPKPDAPVVWGKLIHTVRSDGIPMKTEYFDDGGTLVRTMLFEQVKTMDGREVPTLWTILPADKPDQKTVMTIEAITFDRPIAEDVFSRANLSRRGR